jgi:hypothetical protein
LGRAYGQNNKFGMFRRHWQQSTKLWFFMEMNRNSVIREVKRMEIALNRLER